MKLVTAPGPQKDGPSAASTCRCPMERYDVALTIQHRKLKPTIYAALAKLGLEVAEAPRTIKMLRLSPALAGKVS
ncbi:hypothetical protein [Hymenobacter sp.]|uniref:hypothetical protein n=1 Tax=Hymenobacter sp. TaxID=1898978 RepID=UPI00286C6FD6|nr:hypothetical protein [Hymenobacter sp.]